MKAINYKSFTFTIEAKETIFLPPYKGSTLRGGFGYAFKRVVCALKDKECLNCILKEKCIYSYIFETPPPSDTKIMRKYKAAPHPFIIEPPPEKKKGYKAGDDINFGLILIGKAIDYLPYFIYAFHNLGEIGIGKGRSKFQLKKVSCDSNLSKLAKEKTITKWEGKSDELETKLLDRAEGKEKMSSDPFRMVKVSDLLPAGEIKIKIVYAVNRKKEKSDKATLAEKSGVYQIFETIQPGAVFEGTININTPEQTAGISTPIKPENLLLSSHRFYAGNLKEEITPLNEALGIKHQAGISANTKFQDKFKKSAFLIRLGRHSGAEAVTIEGNRYIKIMQGRDKQPQYLDHGTTLWLASEASKPNTNNGLIPFGWAVIEVIN